jgi:hypothetical protein
MRLAYSDRVLKEPGIGTALGNYYGRATISERVAEYLDGCLLWVKLAIHPAASDKLRYIKAHLVVLPARQQNCAEKKSRVGILPYLKQLFKRSQVGRNTALTLC